MILQKIMSAVDWLGDLSADMFWGTATSYPAISLMGALAAASFAVSRTPVLVERFFPVIAPYTRGAVIVCLVASAWVTFAFGYRVADGREEIERLKNNLAWSEFMLGEQKAAADAAFELKRQADAESEAAKGKLNEYQLLFGDTPGVLAPPRGYLEWLHTLQRRKPRAAGADQPRRNLVARMRAFGEKRR